MKFRGYHVKIQTGQGEVQREVSSQHFTLGRSHTADVSILHPDISRSHLAVHYENAQVFIEDLGSKNGTFLKGKKIRPHELVSYNNGDLISFGSVPDEVYIFAEFEVETPCLPTPEEDLSSMTETEIELDLLAQPKLELQRLEDQMRELQATVISLQDEEKDLRLRIQDLEERENKQKKQVREEAEKLLLDVENHILNQRLCFEKENCEKVLQREKEYADRKVERMKDFDSEFHSEHEEMKNTVRRRVRPALAGVAFIFLAVMCIKAIQNGQGSFDLASIVPEAQNSFEYRPTYTERLLGLKGYGERELNAQFRVKWTEFLEAQWKAEENLPPGLGKKISDREFQFVKMVNEIVESEDHGLSEKAALLNSYESAFLSEIESLLGENKSIEDFQEWKENFYSEYYLKSSLKE